MPRLARMPLSSEPAVPITGLVDIPGSLISTLARDPPKRVPGRRANSSHIRRDNDESEDENDPPPHAQGPVPPPGGSDGDLPQDGMTTRMRKMRLMNPWTPKWGKPTINRMRTWATLGRASSKSYRPHVRNPWQGCSATSVTSPSKLQNAIMVYIGIYSIACLSAFHQHHWKDTFAKWQKRLLNRDGTECVMVLPLPQQDYICCAAWVCRHYLQLQWPA